MKKILLTAVVLFALNFASDAQEKKRTNIPYYTVELLDEIGATADQKAKVAELVKEFKPKYDAVKQDASLTEEEKKAKIKEIGYQRGSLYFKILNAEQKAKLDAMKKEVAKNKEGN
ncbi:hypothetical protein ABDJ41_14250 [Pedobacter sp. ASV1-7]|uniref:hypothetical protein n=1 Tax=Pedobacter sp. ASV1-7 TaxID=3145237 RepID=UPI0032E8A9FB